MRILLVIPSFRAAIYSGVKIRAGRIDSPVLSLPTLAGELESKGHTVRILDLNLHANRETAIASAIGELKPQYAGISVVTPLFNEMIAIADIIKRINASITVILGGPHVSSVPHEALEKSAADIVVIGEGEETLCEIVSGKDLPEISGIAFRHGNSITKTSSRPLMPNLDVLAFPAWHLYDLRKYSTSKLMARKSPAGWIETSRGCPFNCSYCNKSVFGRRFRVKSPVRVVDEIVYMLKCGFKEIHIADDMFTTNVQRVKEICDEIISRDLHFPWATVTGIRVDRGDAEMFEKMAKAGCYRIYIGIESGNQDVLNRIGKNIRLQQVRDTVSLARKSRLEICGFFMFALPGETEKSMQDTIDFAKSLDLDFAKASITTPLPSTPLFDELMKAGRIKTTDWSMYNLYMPQNALYDHPNLDWDTVERYYNKFYRKFYLRSRYIMRTFVRAIRNRRLLHYMLYFLKTKW